MPRGHASPKTIAKQPAGNRLRDIVEVRSYSFQWGWKAGEACRESKYRSLWRIGVGGRDARRAPGTPPERNAAVARAGSCRVSGRRNILLLFLIMTATAVTVAGLSIWVLYDAAFAQQREQRIIPQTSELKKIIRYEAHLHRLIDKTLRIIEALQAKRLGHKVYHVRHL